MEEQGGMGVFVPKLRPGKREFSGVPGFSGGRSGGSPWHLGLWGRGAVLCLAGRAALEPPPALQTWTSVAKHHDAKSHLVLF